MATKQEEVRRILDTHFIFSPLSPTDKRAIEDLFEIEKYPAGTAIAEAGRPMTGLYSVYSGSVRMKGFNETGKRISLGEMPEESTFGEVSLLTDANWEQQVTASADTILLKLPSNKLRSFLKLNPHLEQHFRQQIGSIEMRKRLRGILGTAQYTQEAANEILSNIGVKKIKRGTYVFKQGDEDPRLYYIEAGACELVRDMIEGTVVLEKVGKGGLIGETGAVTHQAQNYSALAVTDLTVLVIRQPEVKKILDANYDLKERLEQRIRQLREREKENASALKRQEGIDQRIHIDSIGEADFRRLAKKTEVGKFKLIKQQAPAENVAACLAMISEHFGKSYTVGQVQEMANINTEVASLPQVCTAGEHLGFRAKYYQVKYDQLKQLELPGIILWENYHYVVIYRVTDSAVYVADPLTGLKTVNRREFETGWDGVIVVTEPTQKFKQLESPEHPYARFVGFLLPYKFYFGEAFLAVLVMNVLGLASPLFVQNIVDKVVVHKDSALLNMMLAGMVMITVFTLMTSSAQNLLLAHVIARIDMKMMSEFYRHVLSLPLRFFQSRQIGDILSRFGENQKIRGILAGTTITVVLDALMIVLYILMMLIYNKFLTIMVLIFIPIYIGNTLFFTPRLNNIYNQLFLSSAASQSSLIESLHGIEAIKSTANEYWARSRWEDAFVENVNLGYKSAKIELLFNTVSQLINLSASISILWVGANEVMADKMSIGELMGFNMLMGEVMGPILNMVRLWSNLQEIRIAMDRVNDVAIIKPEQSAMTSTGAPPAVLPRLEGRIEFRNTCFRYGGEDTPLILNNFNLIIEPGQSVAFVGPSGCGKSTAIKMIMGFNMPTGGECLIDGKDITALDLTTYRRQIGIVLQDSYLFSDTVAGNIALGDTEPDMNAVREAARLSSADDFIARLQQGYQTPLGEKGIQVSGGQRQRICIARALYRRPKILIFDEATSALDNESEARIQQNMKQILTGKTSIAIAHRLSTVRDCDFICFMENGQVQEKGSHDELVAQKGRYYDLAKKQFDLE